MSDTQISVSTSQVKELLLARGPQAARIRDCLIGLLEERTRIPNLAELPMEGLVGEMLAIEALGDPLGCSIQTIIAPTPIEEPESHKAARRIMGNNFRGISEVAKAFGPVSLEMQTALANIPFGEEVLRSRRHTHVLEADIGLSMIDVRGRMEPGLFFSYEDAWYNPEEFANRTEQVAWRLIRKTPVAHSTSKNWADQIALLDEDEEVSTARRVVYAIMLVFATTGERLFERIYVRTSDVDSVGRRVFLGLFDRDGLRISGWNGPGNGHLGVAASSQKQR